jgi:hypothetical protein
VAAVGEAVELRRCEICAGLLQDLFCLAQFTDLTLKFLDPVLLRACLSRALTSVTDLDLLAGANLIAVQGPAGWELLQAREATLIGPGQYRLRQFLRGQRGTESAMGAAAGSPLIVIDAACQRLPVALAALGQPRTFRAGPASRPFTDSSYAEAQFTPQGTGLRPFAPVHLRARRDTATGDITLTWTRRRRALEADSW